jgi:hypothetical protein
MSSGISNPSHIAIPAHHFISIVALHISGHNPISHFLQSAEAHFLTIGLRILSRAVRDIHVLEIVCPNRIMVEPWAIASFPFGAALNAKLCAASTLNVLV